MGWQTETPTFQIYVRLDNHAGEKEREHEQLYQELCKRISEAIKEIVDEDKYKEISAELW